MIYTLLVMTALLPAQAQTCDDEALFTNISKDVHTFWVVLQGSDERIHCAIQEKGKYLKHSSPTIGDNQKFVSIQLLPDYPWLWSDSKTVSRRTVEIGIEQEMQRKVRLKEGWKLAGFECVQTPGSAVYVTSEEADYARRAQRMENEVTFDLINPPAQEILANTVVDTAQTPGFLKQWGGHILVIVVGGVLLVLVLVTMVFGGKKA
jgi:hypothetical protein